LKSSLGMGMDRIKFENFVKEVYTPTLGEPEKPPCESVLPRL
jgi:hypothetical protein